jgi:NADH kinase
MIISSPTGSTAYSLSSGGSIVHPLVPSLLLTPICPRSLSFRPLVLPAETPITLRLGDKNRGKQVEVSIDGNTITQGLDAGMEVRVAGEDVRTPSGEWLGGVPSIVRGTMGREDDTEDHWVGGLNALLKFNYPFGDQDS